MANLRGGVQGDRGAATRLGSEHMHVWADTWRRQVDVFLFKNDALRISVSDKEKRIFDVHLPNNQGPDKNSFEPRIYFKGKSLDPVLVAQFLGKP